MVFRNIATIKNKLYCLTYRRSLCSRLLRISSFQVTRKNIEVERILEKYQSLKKVKVVRGLVIKTRTGK